MIRSFFFQGNPDKIVLIPSVVLVVISTSSGEQLISFAIASPKFTSISSALWSTFGAVGPFEFSNSSLSFIFFITKLGDGHDHPVLK